MLPPMRTAEIGLCRGARPAACTLIYFMRHTSLHGDMRMCETHLHLLNLLRPLMHDDLKKCPNPIRLATRTISLETA